MSLPYWRSITRGTLYCCSPEIGALARATAFASGVPSTSSRRLAVSGASNYFLGGVTAYSLEQKVRHLGVDRAGAEHVNSVSAAVAEQMAAGVCRLFGSELGLATTGYAEPFDAAQGEVSPAAGKIQPFAFWALAHELGGGRRTVRSGRVDCPGATRVQAQEKVAETVVVELVKYLRELRG